jgi:hypothetical protein
MRAKGPMKKSIGWLLLLAALAAGCAKAPKEAAMGTPFKDDLEFLRANTKVLVLSDPAGQAMIALNPDLQGRVMTSTAAGPEGTSFGWMNRELLASKVNNPHMNAFGGEDRFWLGPEGGQFSIFFKKGEPFDLEHWFTPPPVNEGGYEIAVRSDRSVTFTKRMTLENYSGTVFEVEATRRVFLAGAGFLESLGISLPAGVRMVGFGSDNEVKNVGTKPWTKDTGLLSIWILGMFNPSPETTIVVPFEPGPEGERGTVVNDAYFGKVPADRLIVADNVLFFKGDGLFRSKIGLSPRRAKNILGSYDAAGKTLTLALFLRPSGAMEYVNSMWEIQKEPFGGDVVNSYNDGPASPGAKPLGPFYELETSSPALALGPGESGSHRHMTFHFQGEEKDLDPIARKALGVGLDAIKSAFGPRR